MLSSKPILTIGVPTYNRAKFLAVLLDNLCPQIEGLSGKVQLAISDNGSTDNTRELCENACRRYDFIQYNCNQTNLYCTGNIKFIAENMAIGEYCWFLGDDDLVTAGGLAYIVSALEKNPDIDYFFLNYDWMPYTEREHVVYEEQSRYQGSRKQMGIGKDVRLKRWEDILLLPCSDPAELFNGLLSHILRTSVWKREFPLLKICAHSGPEEWESCLDCQFPFIKAIAPPNLHKPIYVVAPVYVIQGMGLQEFLPYSAAHILIVRYRIIEYFEALGVDERIIGRMKEGYYRTFGPVFIKYCENPYTEKMEGIFREHFTRLAKEKEFWQAIKGTIQQGDRNQASVKQYYRRLIANRLLAEELRGGKGLVVWGYGELGRQIIDGLDDLTENLTAVVDANEKIHGRPVPNTKICVIRPEELCRQANVDVILVASVFFAKDILRTIREVLHLKVTILSVDGVHRPTGD